MTQPRKTYVRPLDLKHGHVDMAHGSGGRAMAQLIDELFARHLGNDYLAQGDDGALLPPPGEGRLVMATDAHVVSPLFFPGGDIGSMAIHGTVNDLAMSGARPLYLSAGFILEEGTPLDARVRRGGAQPPREPRPAAQPRPGEDRRVLANGLRVGT